MLAMHENHCQPRSMIAIAFKAEWQGVLALFGLIAGAFLFYLGYQFSSNSSPIRSRLPGCVLRYCRG
jgi:hypothetical protein